MARLENYDYLRDPAFRDDAAVHVAHTVGLCAIGGIVGMILVIAGLFGS